MIYRFGVIFSASVLFFAIVLSVSAQKSQLKITTETKAINAAELKSLAKPTNGKPILINFWATWCGPCRVEFPELVKIDADYRHRDLNFIVVSVDDFGLIDTVVPEFLASYNSTMPSYLINLENLRETAKAIRRLAPLSRVAYPLTLLFDAKGKLVFQKVGKVDASILRSQIDKVLIKK